MLLVCLVESFPALNFWKTHSNSYCSWLMGPFYNTRNLVYNLTMQLTVFSPQAQTSESICLNVVISSSPHWRLWSKCFARLEWYNVKYQEPFHSIRIPTLVYDCDRKSMNILFNNVGKPQMVKRHVTTSWNIFIICYING